MHNYDSNNAEGSVFIPVGSDIFIGVNVILFTERSNGRVFKRGAGGY